MFDSEQEAAGYLAGMIDGEGSVYAKGQRRGIQIANSEPSIIEACLNACRHLKIEAYARVRKNPAPMATVPIWTVYVYGRANLERAASVLRLGSERKQEALLRAVSSCVRRQPVKREELEAMLARGMTHREIALALGYKGHSVVQYHLRRFGLMSPARHERCRCRACRIGRVGFEQMLREGMTHAEIARRLGYKTSSAITYHFQRLGINSAAIRRARTRVVDPAVTV